MIHEDLVLNLNILRPLTYVVGDEEEVIIDDVYQKTLDASGNSDSEIHIYRSTFGLKSYTDYKKETEGGKKTKTSQDPQQATNQINIALNEIYGMESIDKRLIYILLDIDHYLIDSPNNQQVIRRIKDIVLQCYRDQVNIKSLIIVSPQLEIPSKLQRYTEVIYYDLPNDTEVNNKVGKILTDYNETISDSKSKIETTIGPNIKMNLKGLTNFEIEQITLASIKKHGNINIDMIRNYKKSILKKTHLLEMEDTDLTFNDVGGMTYLKDWLNERECVWSDDAIKNNIPLLKGLLLLGVPGCGKSLIAKAIANQWHLPLIRLDTSKIFSSRVGESESNMMKALKIVESISPCIMMVDEIEKAFAGSQSSTFSDAGTTSRVIGSFLSWFQDTEFPVFVVATSNGIQYLPPELISRFDDKFFVNIPSSIERQAIWDIQLRNFGRDWKKLDISLVKLADMTPQYTGREIEQICKAGITKWYYERSKNPGKKVELGERHFEEVMKKKVPLVNTMEDEIKYIYQWVGWDEEKQTGIRATYANEKEKGDDIDQLLTEALKADPIEPKFRNKNAPPK
jgi:SpoVK/Ycf46/Vps4 family AAA+-type ATPase